MAQPRNVLICAHCGAAGASHVLYDRNFCCEGCGRVYSILREQNLLGYYDFPANGPASLKDIPPSDFGYCDGNWFKKTFTQTVGHDRYSIRLKLPAIHCAACVWLLEKLPEMLPGITGARINYLAKELTVTAENSLTTAKLVQFVADLGYTPDFSPESGRRRALSAYDKGLIKRMAVAAFGFGNAMLFSLPEYFSERLESRFQLTFLLLNLALSSFILIYAAGEFFANAYRALRRKKIVLDLPIAVGIAAMFGRSIAEILTQQSSGYFDTFAGLIFFLLIGRFVQSRSYSWLNFERDNLLFLPLAVRRITSGEERVTPVQELRRGDTIRLLNGEIAPTRCALVSNTGAADYSFTTGESLPVPLKAGDFFEAGGRVVGQSLELIVTDAVDQARLNGIWEEAGRSVSTAKFQEESSFADKVLPWFAGTVAALALGGFAFWFGSDTAKAWNALSAVLVITCPCALAMAKPFTFYTTQSALGRAGLFLKSAAVVEKFFRIRNIVFDKTGTLTDAQSWETQLYAASLATEEDFAAVASLADQSGHPLSRAVAAHFRNTSTRAVSDFDELPGKGLTGVVQDRQYFLGSGAWLRERGCSFAENSGSDSGTVVHAASQSGYLGYFLVRNPERENLSASVAALAKNYRLTLLSGDSDREHERFKKLFPVQTPLYFGASPERKAELVSQTRIAGETMMIGDGLNDAEALRAANLGIAVSEAQANFSPASDAILKGSAFARLPRLIAVARQARITAIAAYGISFAYNIFGITVALRGDLTPLFCAILMPISSLSVIGFTFFSARFGAYLRRLR